LNVEAVSAKTAKANESIDLPALAENEDWGPDGWWTAKTGGTKAGNSGAKYTVKGNVTLYARWKDLNIAEVVLDDFEEKELDEDGNTGWTNQNSIANSVGDNGGTWYGYASDNGAKVIAYDENGTEEVISVEGPDKGAYSTSEAGMLKTLGTGKLVAALDALDAVNSGSDYYAAIVTPFLGDEPATKINLSGLKSVRFKGRIKGALFITIESPKVTNWAQWGWKIGENSESSDWIDINEELSVSAMTGPDWGNPNVTKEVALTEATFFTLNLDTDNDTRVDLEIDEIFLVFDGQNSIPAEFK